MDRGVWWLVAGWLLFAANEAANGSALGDDATAHSLHLDMIALIMMHVFFVTEAESSQLPTINGFMKGSFKTNLDWLGRSDFLSEASVATACRDSTSSCFVGWAAVARAAKKLDQAAAAATSPQHQHDLNHSDVIGQLSTTSGAVERLMDKSFWAMQTLGLPPVSGALVLYRRLRLQHDRTDYEFAQNMRYWYLFMLLIPAVLHWQWHDFAYFGPLFSIGFSAILALPTLSTLAYERWYQPMSAQGSPR